MGLRENYKGMRWAFFFLAAGIGVNFWLVHLTGIGGVIFSWICAATGFYLGAKPPGRRMGGRRARVLIKLQLLKLKRLEERGESNDSLHVLVAKRELAATYQQGEEHDRAVEVFREIIPTMIGQQGPDSRDVLGLRNGLVGSLGLSGKLEAAQQEIESLYRDVKRVLAEDDELVATVEHNLGSLYLEVGKYKEARELLEAALNRREKYLGKDHPSTRHTRASFLYACRSPKELNRPLGGVELRSTKRRAPGR